MDWHDFIEKKNETKTWKDYIKNYIFTPFLYGFAFGIGHFIAFLILEQNIFKNLRQYAKIPLSY